MKAGTEITAQRANEFGLEPQGEKESDTAFRERISGKLRDMGQLVEAHEAHANALYDDPEGGAMTGIMGAVSQALQRTNYGSSGSGAVGIDIAAGTVASKPSDPAADAMLVLFATLLGGRR